MQLREPRTIMLAATGYADVRIFYDCTGNRVMPKSGAAFIKMHAGARISSSDLARFLTARV